MIEYIPISKNATILSNDRIFFQKFGQILKKYHFEVTKTEVDPKLDFSSFSKYDLLVIDNQQNSFPYDSLFKNSNNHFFKPLIINIGSPPPTYLSEKTALMTLVNNEETSFSHLLELSEKFLKREKLQQELSSLLLHDIRSPLNSLIGYLELLMSGTFGKLEEGHRNILEKSIELGDDTLDLLEELGDVYLFEQSAFTLRKETIDLNNVADAALRTVWIKADNKNIKISKKIPSHLTSLQGDEFQIQRLFLNLLMNAINHTPANSSIVLEAQPFEKDQIKISIKDNGHGLPEKELPHIFEKYYRFSQKNNFKGRGLGLFICKLITEAHGGRIWAENETTGGLAIHFTLPLSTENSK